jgi:hypothetical protein
MGRVMTGDAFKREIDELLENFGRRARVNGRTIEQEIEALTSGQKPLAPEERQRFQLTSCRDIPKFNQL